MTSVSSPCVSLLAVGIWQVLPHSYQNYSTEFWVPSCVQSQRTLPDPHHSSALQCRSHTLDFLTVLSQNIPPSHHSIPLLVLSLRPSFLRLLPALTPHTCTSLATCLHLFTRYGSIPANLCPEELFYPCEAEEETESQSLGFEPTHPNTKIHAQTVNIF